jgi:O-antigen/teichoic acid export membrane protein
VLTGGPVVLALNGGSAAEVTILFAALALFRAPYQVALVVVARVTGGLTTRYVSGDVAAIRRGRRGLLMATLVGVPVGAALGGLLGPWLMPLIFGAGVELSSGDCAVLAAGSTVALTNLMLTVMLMAQGRTWAVLRGWLVGMVAAAFVLALMQSAELTVVSWAFVTAAIVACLTLAWSEHHGGRR